MKITLMFKCPDCVYDSLAEAGINPNNMPDNVEKVMNKFIEFNEYAYIIIDTDTGTAEVMQVKQ